MYDPLMYPPQNIGDSSQQDMCGSSQQNIGGSSSPHPPMSPIHPFNVNDLPMYEPQFSLSNPVDEVSPVEEIPPQRKKMPERRLKMMRKSIVMFHGPL
ncbi:hypothetical protein Tco_0285818 [Tanacetum coccineum]